MLYFYCKRNLWSSPKYAQKTPHAYMQTDAPLSIYPLCTKNLQPLLNVDEALLTRWRHWGTEHQLCAQLPVLRDVPCLCNLLVDQGVVVLEVGAESFLLESSPDHILVHSIRVCGPGGELVGVGGKFLLHSCDGGSVHEEEDLQEIMSVRLSQWGSGSGWGKGKKKLHRGGIEWELTHSSICSLETVQFLLRAGVLLSWYDGLENLLSDIPKLDVLLFQQDNHSCRLGVEGRRDMEEGFGDDLLDLSIRDRRLLLELVNGAAILDRLEERC